MAFTKAKSRSSIVRHRSAGVSKARFSEAVTRAANAGKRLREATKEDEDALVMVGTGVALAAIESKTTIPTVWGIDPLVLGGGLAYAATRRAKGKSTRMVRSAAIAALTVGANRSVARGSIRVSGDDDDDDL